MEKYYKKLSHGDYSFLPALKNQIESDKDNYELWYILFLAENKNYNGFDFNKVVDIEAFNKAKELAPSKKKIIIDAELQLYSNIKNIGNFNAYFRYYQFNKYEDIINRLLVELDDFKVAANTSKIANAIEIIFSNLKNARDLNVQIILLNALYIKTGDEVFKKMFKEKINDRLYNYSDLGIKNILETSNELKSYLSYDKVLNTRIDEEEKALREERLQKLIEKKEAEALLIAKEKPFEEETKSEEPKIESTDGKYFKEEQDNSVIDYDLIRAKSNEQRAKELAQEEDATNYLIVGIVLSILCCGTVGWIILILGYAKGVKGSKECLIALILLAILDIIGVIFLISLGIN